MTNVPNIRNWALAIILLPVLCATARAQPPGTVDVHQPLDQNLPPGTAGRWAGMMGKAGPGSSQPIRVELPSRGKVGVYSGRPLRVAEKAAPGQFTLSVGHTYRLRISHMPEFPGIELFPTLEVLDGLHPPPGNAEDFPITVEFTFEEIQFALSNRLVTKVVYLEQPQLAAPVDLQKPLSVLTLPPRRNVLAEADRLGRPLVIIRLGGRLPDVHANDNTFFRVGSPASPLQRGSIFTPAEPRIALSSTGNTESGNTASGPALHPDEYLFDGGDRDLPIHYDEFNRNGLDTEDTIAEYVDHLGGRHVKPTNRVAVYAPRFSAMRTVSYSEENSSVDRLAGTLEMSRGSRLSSRTSPTLNRQGEGTGGIHMRSRGSGLEGNAGQSAVHQAARAKVNEKLQNLFQELAFVRTGRFVQSDEAQLAYGIQAALNWTRDQSPVIAAKTGSSQEVYGSFRPQEYIGREDQRKTKGDLRIVKLADKKTAAPGDVITFTIRYDNLGDRELYHIRIIDNLTPRLVYVNDSATCDRAGRLVVEDNEEGSLILRFELDDSLPGHRGGVVTFQARVR